MVYTIVSIWYLTMRHCRQTSFSGKCLTKFEFFNSVRFSPLCLYVAIVYQFLILFDSGSLFMLSKVDGVVCYWFYLFTKLFLVHGVIIESLSLLILVCLLVVFEKVAQTITFIVQED